MPRPSRDWEKKYGYNSRRETDRLSGIDTVLTAVNKLAGESPEAAAILLQAIRGVPEFDCMMRLLDADAARMYGDKIVKVYHTWAGNDYSKLLNGLRDRDPLLIQLINATKE